MNYTQIKDLIDNNNCSNKEIFNKKFNDKLNLVLNELNYLKKEIKLHNILVNKLLYEHNKFIDADEEEEKLDEDIENLKKKLKFHNETLNI